MASDAAFPIGIIHRKLGSAGILSEPLFFPELTRFAPDRDSATSALTAAITDFLPRLKPDTLLQRRRAATGKLHSFRLTVSPPRTSEAWRTPVELRFHAAIWEHDGGFTLARVPVLGIEIIVGPKDDFTALLQRESLAAVRRLNLSTALQPLAWAQTTTAAKVEWTTVSVRIPSLKERAVREAEEDAKPKKSVLRTVASPYRDWWADPAFEMDDTVKQIADALTAKPAQSVLLIGPSGVGKTAAVGELIRRAASYRLGSTPFYRTSGARLVAGQTGFGMWEQRCQELIREASKERAVLHIGSLAELMDVGKSECNPTGIAAFLRPAIARGELLCIAECTPEQLPLIEKEDPQLPDAFRQITLEEPGPERARTILTQFAATDRRREPNASALATIDRLHRRYATYSAYPGRPLRFLDNLRRDGERGTTITEPEVYTAFGRETGLPRSIIDPTEPLDLQQTRDWFAGRVVGQSDAVDLVVDLLATVKAGLARPNRPVASLLFVGPTGVGKTEMAKSLAEFLFGSVDRLTRFDMSEYADPIAVRRLIGVSSGSEGLLTAAVREQPFSVLLLDEVEKADRSAFDLLLQALGEARLTDAGGRLADFRNAVVILTSNLGAESFRSGKPGFSTSGGPSAAEATEHFGKAVERFLRPEMVNRLDRIVPFAPLGTEVIRKIADREWGKVLARDGVRFRGITVDTGAGLLDHLAEAGFDPKYGARPLKRAMERELLAPLAQQMNRHAGDIPLSVTIGVEAGSPVVQVRPVQGPRGRTAREPNSPAGKLATATQELRRWHQLLEQSSVVRELDNDVYQLTVAEQEILRRQRRGRPINAADAESLAKLGRLREVHAELHRHRTASYELEDEAIVRFHTGGEQTCPQLCEALTTLQTEWDDLIYRLYAMGNPAQTLTVALFSEHRVNLAELAEAFLEVAKRHGINAMAFVYTVPTAEEAARAMAKYHPTFPRDVDPATVWESDYLFEKKGSVIRPVMHRSANRELPLLDDFPDQTIGVVLEMSGPATHLRFAAEAGLHKFVTSESEDTNPNVLVFVSSELVQQYRPPVEMVRRGAVKAEKPRRIYDRPNGRVDDRGLDRVFTGLWGELHSLLEPVLTATVRQRLNTMILE